MLIAPCRAPLQLEYPDWAQADVEERRRQLHRDRRHRIAATTQGMISAGVTLLAARRAAWCKANDVLLSVLVREGIALDRVNDRRGRA